MADTKISELTEVGAVVATDIVPVVDVSDTSQGAGGSTRKITAENLIKFNDTRTATITNKTIDADNNTISNIALGAEATGAVNDLSDVTITTPADNEVLAYDNGTGTWINQTAAEASLASATHTHVEADITDLGAYIENVVEDTTPQLGGNLDLNSNNINLADGESINYESGALQITSDSVNFGTGTIVIKGAATAKEIASSTAFRAYSNTGDDGLGNWEPYIQFEVDGSAAITNTTQGVAGTRILDLNFTSGVKVTSGQLDVNSLNIVNVANGSASGDAVNKGQLDTKIANVVEDTTPQLGGMLDVNGNALGDGTLELVKFIETASAVNEITITNAATTGAPEISATGDDTNIGLKLTPKGSGALVLDGLNWPTADGSADQVLKTDGSGSLSFATASGGASAERILLHLNTNDNALSTGSLKTSTSGGSVTYFTTSWYQCITSTGSTDYASIYTDYAGINNGNNDDGSMFFDYNPTFICTVAVDIDTNSNHEACALMGGYGTNASISGRKAAGFYFYNNASNVLMDAMTDDFTSQTYTNIASLPTTSFGTTNSRFARLVANMTSGTDVKFYSGGTLVATHTTNLPSGVAQGYTENFKVSNNGSTAAKQIAVRGSQIYYDAY